jgi:hypothetical protein
MRFKLTMLQFYASRLAFRDDWSIIHLGRKLFHQYLVDSYIKIEANNLNWIKNNQNILHVERYTGLMDYVRQNTDTNLPIGRLTILPSSFQVV